MKRYLKDYILTVGKVEDAIYDCLKHKWKRKDVSYFLAEYMKKPGENIHDVARYCKRAARYRETRYLLYETISKAASEICDEIYEERISLQPINYQQRYDKTSDKLREIGISTIKQQVLDYVAVNACLGMFMAKIGHYQVASISDRGQIFGKKAIERWIRQDYKNTKYYYKCDIRKYYPSINCKKLKQFLRRDVKNCTILYLLFTLIDSYKIGLCIGSYLSQYLANYFLSYAYHYVTEFSYSMRRKRNGVLKRVNHVSHVLFYMDDVIIFSGSIKSLLRAIKDFKYYISQVLGLTIKSGDKIYKTAEKPIDMMGFVISIKNTIIRDRLIVKIRRIFSKAHRRPDTFSLYFSRRLLSYNGWLKYSDLYLFKRKFKTSKLIDRAKKVIKYYDKRNFYRKTDSLQLLSA